MTRDGAQRKPAPSLRRRLWRFVCRTVFVLLATGVVLLTALLALLRVIDPPVTAFMLHAHHEARRDGSRLAIDQRWVDYAQLPDTIKLAVLAAEDQRFLQHRGLDTIEIRHALHAVRAGSGTRGASTLSQQTVKNLFLWPGQSWLRKGLEAGITLAAEQLWPKRRILELYLNIAEFGPGIYGVEAAAQHFFGKPASRLDAAESALLAAVLPNPRRFRADAPSDYVRERQRSIRAQMPRVAQLPGVAELLH